MVLALAACGGDDPDPAAGGDETSESPTESAEPTETPSASVPTGDPAPPDDKPFGADCKKFRTNGGVGPEEFRDSMDIATFAVLFTDLVGDGGAIMDNAGLLGESDATYFLPVNEALEVLSFDQMGDLLHDEEQQRATMSRHIVTESLAPSALAGEHDTLAGGTPLQVTVDGADVAVGLQGADVLCGNIQLKQGVRVYVIDQLLIT
jgi:hypothetical protein